MYLCLHGQLLIVLNGCILHYIHFLHTRCLKRILFHCSHSKVSALIEHFYLLKMLRSFVILHQHILYKIMPLLCLYFAPLSQA